MYPSIQQSANLIINRYITQIIILQDKLPLFYRVFLYQSLQY